MLYPSNGWKSDHRDLVELFLPRFNSRSDVNPIDIDLARASWKKVLVGKCPSYSPVANNKFHSCKHWFIHSYFSRISEVFAMASFCKREDLLRQASLIVDNIDNILDIFSHPVTSSQKAIYMSEFLIKRNVDVVSFSYFIPALLWTFQYALKEEFSEESYSAWEKIFSFLLQELVPRNLFRVVSSKASTTSETTQL